jgi:hypothetical protein
MLPGIESWYELGNKSRTSHMEGEKSKPDLRTCQYDVPVHSYAQTNFVLGLDSDSGKEPSNLPSVS